MKKSLLIFAATALLLAGCTAPTPYDDTFVLEKLADLETRVARLESSIQAVQSTLGSGKFVQKVQELTDEAGRTVGITVTYTTGEVVNFTISKVTDPDAAPVISVMMNGAGELCWAIDGVILQKDGKDVLVYVTPTFEIGEDGHLYVVVSGERIDLGPVKGDKGDPGKDGEVPVVQDGIITGLEVGEDTVIISYENGTIELPLARSFQLIIEQTEFKVQSTDPIEIPYTVKNADENTVVDVFYDKDLPTEVLADKFVVKPAYKDVEGMVLAFADSKSGLTSIVKLTFEGDIFKVTDDPAEPGIDYLLDSDATSVDVNIVSNVEFDIVPKADWIQYVATKAQHYTVNFSLQPNTEPAIRVGSVDIVRKGTTELLQTITIAQKGKDKYTNLAKGGTANSYIVYSPGEYIFPAVKGNSAESVGAVASVNVLWETWNDDQEVVAGSVVASTELYDGKITIAVPDPVHPGNAVIAAKDADGTILWSWHIWVPETKVETGTYGLHVNEFMDRYLGALVVADEAGAHVHSFGLMYQWGRKDPIVGAKSTTSSSNATVAGEAFIFPDTGTTSTVEEAIQNPTMFCSTQNGDWLAVPDNTLWVDEAKTIYDPCPPGYRVPARDKEQPFFAADLSGNANWFDSADLKVFKMGDPATVFAYAGYRDDYGVKSVTHTGDRVFIWSAHNDGDAKGYGLNVRAGSSHALGSTPKSRGASVRCIAE